MRRTPLAFGVISLTLLLTGCPTGNDKPVTPSGSTIEVPDVVGLDWEAAKSFLMDKGFRTEEGPTLYRGSCPTGRFRVIAQSPGVGTRMTIGSVVALERRCGDGSLIDTPRAEDLSGLPVCEGDRVRVASAGLDGGLTGGGNVVDIVLATPRDCWLHQPTIMVVDARDRIVTFGVVEIDRTKILRRSGMNRVSGEWRNACTKATEPLRVQLVIENELISRAVSSKGMPTCFVDARPTEPYARHPTGSLGVSLTHT